MLLRSSLPFFLALSGALIPRPTAAQEEPASHRHIRHALEAFPAAPDGAGLLPAAEADALVAARHAGLAGSDPTNIDPMQQHARHVLHAVDPSRFASGPGSGFGVKAAVDGIVQHIELAAGSEGASENVQRHAAHVATAARAVSNRVDEIAALAEQILAGSDYFRASGFVEQMKKLCDGLVEGIDANNDGSISLDEGGLQHVRQHLALMADGEGLGS